MKRWHHYYVYILTNRPEGTLYIGVTNDLIRRVSEHRTKSVQGFSAQYNLYRLVHYESFRDVIEAITREKVLKGWRRCKKLALIHNCNPTWRDLWKDISS